MTFDLDDALDQLRAPVGYLTAGTAGVGILMAAHWQPLALLMAPFFLLCVLLPSVGRQGAIWFAIAALWMVAVIVQRDRMEDHVYLYVAWLVAVAVALTEGDDIIGQAGRHGRRLIAIVFGFATLWKLISGSFLSGASLWTTGLIDDRMAPLQRVIGISADSVDAARPAIVQLVNRGGDPYEIELSGYSSFALTAVVLGTLAIEALISATHLAPDTHWMSKLRVPAIVVFGVVTYSVVPVLPFALLLALIASTIANFDRGAMIALAAMVLVTLVRFATL